MVLHKQLRVLNKGTPCVVLENTDNSCIYSGDSDVILSRIISTGSFKDSFVKRIDLVDRDSEEFGDYGISNNSFLKIIVKKR